MHSNHGDQFEGELAPVKPTPIASPGVSVQEQGMDVSRFVRGLKQRAVSCVFLGVLCAVGAAAVAWQVIPDGGFVANALIRVRQGEQVGLNHSAVSRNSDEAYRDTQLRLITLPHVVRRALDDSTVPETLDFEADADQMKWFQRTVEVELRRGSEIMEVSVTQPDAAAAQAFANALANSFILESRVVDRPVQYERRMELEEEYTRVQEELTKSWEELQQLARSIGSEGGEAGTLREQFQLDSYREETRRLRDLRTELRMARHELSTMDSSDDSKVQQAILEAELMKDPAYNDLSRQIVGLERDIAEYTSLGASENDPTVVRLKQQISQLQTSQQKLTEQLLPKMQDHASQVAAVQNGESRRTLESRIAVLQREEQSIQEFLRDAERQLANVDTEAVVRMEMLRRDIDRRENVADGLWSTLQSARIRDEVGNDVRMLAEAELPVERDSSRRMKGAAAAGLLGFLLVVGLIGAVEYLTGRLTTATEIHQVGGVRLLGTVPRITDERYQVNEEGEPDAAWVTDWNLRASLDAIATRLIYSRGPQNCCLMVTSAQPAEGKSTLAFHLAAALVQMGRKVLLVELDLHLPTLATRMNMPPTPGVTDVVTGRARLSDAILPTRLELLDFLPAGELVDDPRAVTTSREFAQLIQYGRENYEFVIFDVPPVMATVEATIVGQQMDYAVLSALRNVSRTRAVQTAVSRLQSVGVRILGAVVGGCVPDSKQYGGYYSRYRRTYQSSPPRRIESSTVPKDSPTASV